MQNYRHGIELLVWVLVVFSSTAFAQIPDGAVLWLDANVGVTEVSGLVRLWEDQSGQNNDAYQNTSGNRPIQVDNALNGFPIIRFDGDDDFLQVDDQSSLNPDQLTLFVVGKYRDGVSNTFVNKSTSSLRTDGYGMVQVEVDQVAEVGLYVDNVVRIANGPVVSDTYTIMSGRYNESSIDFYTNGSLQESYLFSNSISHSSKELRIGAARVSSLNSNPTLALEGDIAEIILYPSALDDSDRYAVESYLGTKYGIPVAEYAPEIVVDPSELDFNFTLQNTSYSVTLTVENEGSAPLIVSDITASDDAFVPAETAFTVAPFSTHDVIVTFTPTHLTSYTADLTVLSDDYDEPEKIVPMTGVGFDIPRGMNLWLRADRGIVGSTSDLNYLVQEWQDQSGHGHHATQSAIINRPFWRENVIELNWQASLYWDLEYNPLGQFLRIAHDAELEPSTITLFVVASIHTDWTTWGTLITKTPHEYAQTGYALQQNGAFDQLNFWINPYAATGSGVTSNFSSGDENIFMGRYTPGDLSIFRDGRRQDQSTYADGIIYEGNVDVLIGAETTESGESTTNFYDGYIAEILLYPSALSREERLEVEDYLSAKYGITLDYDGAVIATTPTSLDFGAICLDTPQTSDLRIINAGDQDLVVTDITRDNDAFTISETAFTVPFGSSHDIQVTFTPTAAESYSGTLTIISNAANNDALQVPVNGTGLSEDAAGHSLHFDGMDDVVIVNDTLGLNLTYAALTVEAWVYLDRLPENYATVINQYDDQGNATFWLGVNSAGNVEFWVYGTTDAHRVSSVALEANRWYHIAGTFGSLVDLHVYIDAIRQDGTLEGTIPYYLDVVDQDIWIGNEDSGEEHGFSGNIDLPRIWYEQRNPAELLRTVNWETIPDSLSTQLIASWNFNEGSGDLAADDRNPAYDGHIEGASWHCPGAPLNISYDAIISASRDSVDFSEVAVGTLGLDNADTLWIYNSGTDDLVVSDISSSIPGVFIAAPQNFTVAPGERQLLTLTFYPIAEHEYNAQLWFFSNDPDFDRNPLVVKVHGVGIPDPDPYCLMFDGTDDYVSIPHDPSLDFTGQMTAEFWMWIDAYPVENQYLLAKTHEAGDASDPDQPFQIYVDATGYLNFARGTGSQLLTVTSTRRIPLELWTHVACVYNDSALVIYLNGVRDATQDAPDQTFSTSDGLLCFGAAKLENSIHGNFSGKLDDVRLWQRGLRAVEIETYKNTTLTIDLSELGLVSAWNFEESSGQTIGDTQGNNDGYRGENASVSGDDADPAWTTPGFIAFAEIASDPTSFDFGQVYVGSSVTQTLTIHNLGNEWLTGTASVVDPFTLNNLNNFGVAVVWLGTQEISVTFAPSTVGLVEDFVYISTNDEDESLLSLPIRGEGISARPCGYDLNCDGVIDIIDVEMVSHKVGSMAPEDLIRLDVVVDGVIDEKDVDFINQQWDPATE
ncbi:MAG: choice-of-anchor D domain-containing protein [Gemmatimonadetes bacterium]|nr:MAG: choice-of-anchor D domain-containing protein [Gemmatimonadota bacterium]